MKKIIFTIFGVLIFCGLFAQEIPQKISYQGKLLESGVPVTGTKSIVFTIDTWTETHPNVQVTDGLYSVTLGETTPIPTSIFDNTSSINLQISVAGTDLTPQTEILSVPYSYKAEKSVDAEKIAGNTVSTTAPSTNQVLKWNGTTWAPGTDETGGLTLPYSGTYSGSSTAFQIIHTGTGSTYDVADFEINNPTNSGYVLKVKSNGLGDVIDVDNDGTGNAIWINNSTNSLEAIKIINHSNDEAIHISNNGTGDAIKVFANGGYAGNFYGDVHVDGNLDVSGNLSKGGGSFKIDHPLDPENKYLYHSFVESPDMMNVYNGNIITDENGFATIQLPEYFEALNKDFRYQLTCFGVFTQAIVYEKLNNNSFTIKTEVPNVEVSWQITGIRKDPYAEQNRIQVEVEKSEEEKGHYLHYKEYEQPIEKSIEAVKHPEILEELKENNKK